MAAFTSIATGNWNDGPTTWGTGAGVYPGSAQAGDTVTIGGNHVITLNVDPAYTLASITNADNSGYITVGTTRAITLTASTGYTYSGTGTTNGGLKVTAGTLTITGGGAGTTAVTNSAAGYAVVSTGGSVSISNVGGLCVSSGSSGRGVNMTSGSGTLTITSGTSANAVLSTGTGRAISHASTGALSITGGTGTTNAAVRVTTAAGIGVSQGANATSTITGDVYCNSAGGIGVSVASAGSITITGDVIVAGSSSTITSYPTGVTSSAGSCVVKGKFISDLSSGTAWAVYVSSGGTVTWDNTATRLVDASTDATIFIGAGAFSIAGCTINVSGRLLIYKAGGTFTTTGSPTINLMSTAAQATIIGAAFTVTGPTIPVAADVRYNVARGYPGDAVGAISAPNSGTPTATEDATSDACVVSGKNYGAANARTGSASAGSANPGPTLPLVL